MLLNDYTTAIEQTIATTQYGQSPIELYEPISYIMGLGGKRIRPLLTVMATALFTENWQQAVRPAVGVEIFHNFTLMHDDIMDKAPIRRGQPTVHEKWNDNVAILSGDVMLVSAYEFLTEVEPAYLKAVIKKFNRAAAEVCEGQQWDMNFEKRMDVTKAQYLEMIRLKTAVLLGFALELGGIIGGTDEENARILKKLGDAVGTGFQLKDDLLDVYGDPGKFGKLVGGDILANKKTFLLIDALEKATGSDQEELQFWLSPQDHHNIEKVQAVTALYDRLGVRQTTEAEMNRYFEEGFEYLKALRIADEKKEVLQDFFQNLIEREK
ncbi:isoprenyl synthetase [Siphonobacter sp. BAB-5385]|uniref:polyprenyl synthetase family protein n=1 Tax=unclassified Siphonobacter TaxID=2635712 RepID=UPI000B9E6C89|nr:MULTISPECIES: polyprenyl synthetase family protein [unclassified Siphonobacter]OZI08759.1 isoprenyl synthetase [Siphonobacter sp. BAB-5385]PMD99380.1 isoprenyl synthetase [Siphonobacter sp. BAB-5405]